MARIGPFENHSSQYENWFDKNRYVYLSELEAIQRTIPMNGKGIEIGIGSGRFAAPLGIKNGIEPSRKMIELAVQKDIHVIKGIAEALPIGDDVFNFALMVTTICFLDNIEKAFKEVHRILKGDGSIIVGFVDKDSLIGRQYQKNKNQSVFYNVADFYSTNEVLFYLKRVGFTHFSFVQTIFQNLKDIKRNEPVKIGYGEGSFVVIKGKKTQ